MKVFLTGSNGFIGKHILRYLIDNPKVESILAHSRKILFSACEKFKTTCSDLTYDSEYLRDELGQYKPDLVIHTAGLSTQNHSMADFHENNIVCTMNLLDSLPRSLRRCNFLYFSSIVAELYPVNFYGASKHMVETMVRSYADQGFINACIIRPCAVVGAGNTHGLLRDVVRKVLNNDTVELIGTAPGSIKPYIYIKDLIKSIDYIIRKNKFENLVLTASNPDSISVQNVLEIVQEETGIQKPIQWNPALVWRGDHSQVYSEEIDLYMEHSSKEAIRLATRDILKEQKR